MAFCNMRGQPASIQTPRPVGEPTTGRGENGAQHTSRIIVTEHAFERQDERSEVDPVDTPTIYRICRPGRFGESVPKMKEASHHGAAHARGRDAWVVTGNCPRGSEVDRQDGYVEGLCVMSVRDDLFNYTQCGLDNVWLRGGVTKEETGYGGGFSVEHADELHHAIAKAIINENRPLRGQEARFLRVLLNLSQEAMAKALGVDRATVIRWERARDRALTTMQDIAVRTTYAARTNKDDFVLDVIRELQEADELAHGDAYRQVFEASNRGWHEKRAA